MARLMRSKFETARLYRDKAEELRTIADGLNCESERQLLRKLAEDSERLAASAEARGRRAELHNLQQSG